MKPNVIMNTTIENKRLHVFDFDSTLITSDNHQIKVTQANGTVLALGYVEWSNYVPLPGDVFDYSALDYLHNPKQVEKVWNIFLQHLNQKDNTHILTARGTGDPLEKYFKEQNLEVKIKCLGIPPGDNNGHHKAKWINDQINDQKITEVHFYDDREDCVVEVANLRNKHPNVVFKVWHVWHARTVQLREI